MMNLVTVGSLKIKMIPKMNIHKDKMLWYNTGYCIKVIKKDKEDL